MRKDIRAIIGFKGKRNSSVLKDFDSSVEPHSDEFSIKSSQWYVDFNDDQIH